MIDMIDLKDKLSDTRSTQVTRNEQGLERNKMIDVKDKSMDSRNR